MKTYRLSKTHVLEEVDRIYNMFSPLCISQEHLQKAMLIFAKEQSMALRIRQSRIHRWMPKNISKKWIKEVFKSSYITEDIFWADVINSITNKEYLYEFGSEEEIKKAWAFTKENSN